MPKFHLWCRDLREKLVDYPDNHFDGVFCDPPYGLSKQPDMAEVLKHWLAGDDYHHTGGGFMGKSWDSFVPGPATWREVLRVLKPGGHALIFGGTRTFDLLSTALRLAGFEVRDCCMFMYGCLSEDTEALTRRGWVNGVDLRADDDVMQWDAASGALSWTRPQCIVRKPWDGLMVRLANRHTDQLLTPDHRVYARVGHHSRNASPVGWTVTEAADLRPSWAVDIPMAGTLADGKSVDPDYAYLVGWWLTDAWLHGDGKACMFSQCKPDTLTRLRAALAPHKPSEYTKSPRKPQHSAEHTFYVTGPLAEQLRREWPERKLTWDVLDWSLAARLRLIDGLVDGDGSRKAGQHGVSFWSTNQERRDIISALFLSIGWRAYDNPRKGVVEANPRPSTQIQKRHRDAAPAVHYQGVVWCVTVSTGAFVVRRNGRPFITGNSGFPKSLDISKAIDKAQGNQHEVVGQYDPRSRFDGRERTSDGHSNEYGSITQKGVVEKTAAGSLISEQFNGYGTALKPAYEPVLLVMKPLAGNFAQNALAHGVAGLNIDGSRIATSEIITNHARSAEAAISKGKYGDSKAIETHQTEGQKLGRWPANVLLEHHEECQLLGTRRVKGDARGVKLETTSGSRPAGFAEPHAPSGSVQPNARVYGDADGTETVESWDCHPDCPVRRLDEQSGDRSSARASGNPNNPKRGGDKSDVLWGMEDGRETHDYRDTGGASRFFYTSKTGKKERHAGVESLHWVADGDQLLFVAPNQLDAAKAAKLRILDGNPHPTVKPARLCEYLAKLILPPARPDGHPRRLLVPFSGSGSEAIAAAQAGWDEVHLIEQDPSYCLIAVGRIVHKFGRSAVTTERFTPPMWQPEAQTDRTETSPAASSD